MSNEYKDWLIDRVQDLEYCLYKAVKTLKTYSDTSTSEYEWALSGKLAKQTLKEVHERIDLSTLSDEFVEMEK